METNALFILLIIEAAILIAQLTSIERRIIIIMGYLRNAKAK